MVENILLPSVNLKKKTHIFKLYFQLEQKNQCRKIRQKKKDKNTET